ncbi:MAG: helix-turn-helix transcriptional regulator [Pseudomonadota bacterium]|nr:helix-turn-helix transcriptional regulator [Pseudomonadota bacterium]
MDIRKIVGKNLRRYRKESGYSQEGLAHEVGLHRTYVSGIERAIRNPSIQSLESLARPLGVPVWKLLYDGRK